jgi:hypothetical protein
MVRIEMFASTQDFARGDALCTVNTSIDTMWIYWQRAKTEFVCSTEKAVWVVALHLAVVGNPTAVAWDNMALYITFPNLSPSVGVPDSVPAYVVSTDPSPVSLLRGKPTQLVPRLYIQGSSAPIFDYSHILSLV